MHTVICIWKIVKPNPTKQAMCIRNACIRPWYPIFVIQDAYQMHTKAKQNAHPMHETTCPAQPIQHANSIQFEGMHFVLTKCSLKLATPKPAGEDMGMYQAGKPLLGIPPKKRHPNCRAEATRRRSTLGPGYIREDAPQSRRLLPLGRLDLQMKSRYSPNLSSGTHRRGVPKGDCSKSSGFSGSMLSRSVSRRPKS